MAETMSRLAACEKEVAELKSKSATLRSENEYLRAQLSSWDPNFSLKRDLPDPVQALALWRKITSKYPRMISPSDSGVDQAMGLVAAMAFVFTCAKTETPTTKFDGGYWIARATEFMNSARLSAPRIRSVLIGIVACHDVPFILDNSSIYLDTFGRGKPISRGAWRRLLAGAPVREPMVVNKKELDGSIGVQRQISSW